MRPPARVGPRMPCSRQHRSPCPKLCGFVRAPESGRRNYALVGAPGEPAYDNGVEPGAPHKNVRSDHRECPKGVPPAQGGLPRPSIRATFVIGLDSYHSTIRAQTLSRGDMRPDPSTYPMVWRSLTTRRTAHFHLQPHRAELARCSRMRRIMATQSRLLLSPHHSSDVPASVEFDSPRPRARRGGFSRPNFLIR